MKSKIRREISQYTELIYIHPHTNKRDETREIIIGMERLSSPPQEPSLAFPYITQKNRGKKIRIAIVPPPPLPPILLTKQNLTVIQLIHYFHLLLKKIKKKNEKGRRKMKDRYTALLTPLSPAPSPTTKPNQSFHCPQNKKVNKQKNENENKGVQHYHYHRLHLLHLSTCSHLARELVCDLPVQVHVQEVARLIGQCEADRNGLALRGLSYGHLYLCLKDPQTPQPSPISVDDGADGVLNLADEEDDDG